MFLCIKINPSGKPRRGVHITKHVMMSDKNSPFVVPIMAYMLAGSHDDINPYSTGISAILA